MTNSTQIINSTQQKTLNSSSANTKQHSETNKDQKTNETASAGPSLAQHPLDVQGPTQMLCDSFSEIFDRPPMLCYILVVGYISQPSTVEGFSDTGSPRTVKFGTEVDLDILRFSKYYADSPSPIGDSLLLPKGRKTLIFSKSKVQTLLISELIELSKIAAVQSSPQHQS